MMMQHIDISVTQVKTLWRRLTHQCVVEDLNLLITSLFKILQDFPVILKRMLSNEQMDYGYMRDSFRSISYNYVITHNLQN